MAPSERLLIPIYIIHDINTHLKKHIDGDPNSDQEVYEYLQRLEYLFIKLSDSLSNIPKGAHKQLNAAFQGEKIPIVQQLKHLRNNLEHNPEFLSIESKQKLFKELLSGQPVKLELMNGGTITIEMFDLMKMKDALLRRYEVYVEQKM